MRCCTLISAWISARWGKEGSIHAIYTWPCFVRMKTQRHFADVPAISTKEAQQQDTLTHRRAQRKERWGRRAVDVYVHVCVHTCERASCQARSVHCLLLSTQYAIWLPRPALIIAMANPSRRTNEHRRQTSRRQLSQWHCLVWEGKHLFSPQISHQAHGYSWRNQILLLHTALVLLKMCSINLMTTAITAPSIYLLLHRRRHSTPRAERTEQGSWQHRSKLLPPPAQQEMASSVLPCW